MRDALALGSEPNQIIPGSLSLFLHVGLVGEHGRRLVVDDVAARLRPRLYPSPELCEFLYVQRARLSPRDFSQGATTGEDGNDAVPERLTIPSRIMPHLASFYLGMRRPRACPALHLERRDPRAHLRLACRPPACASCRRTHRNGRTQLAGPRTRRLRASLSLGNGNGATATSPSSD